MYTFLTLAFILVVCICLSKLFRKNKRYYGIKTFFEIMGAFMIAAVVIFVVIVALSHL